MTKLDRRHQASLGPPLWRLSRVRACSFRHGGCLKTWLDRCARAGRQVKREFPRVLSSLTTRSVYAVCKSAARHSSSSAVYLFHHSCRRSASMETLLSHSFDYLSSTSPLKIRKGLRQLEGLLAQLCLLKTSNAANKRQSMLLLGSSTASPTSKKLTELPLDPAFREFFSLQQNFQWNIAMRLVSCLERLLGKESNGTNDMLIIQTLDLIQGVLLLHSPSRALFAQEIYMNVS
jgi:hypothetical protein